MGATQKRVYRNPTTGLTISSDKHAIGDPNDLANQGLVPIGTEEKVKGGTVFASQRNAETGKRYERFVQDPKPTVTAQKTTVTKKPVITPDGMIKDVNEAGQNILRKATDEEKGLTNKDNVEGGPDRFRLDEPSREDIRTEKLSDAQSVIDAINENYKRQIDTENIAGAGREKRTRSLSVGSGLGGSDFATASAMRTEASNKRITDSITAEKNARVQSILNDVRGETDETYEKRRKEFIAQAEDEIQADKDFATQARTDAIDRARQISSEGVDLSEFAKNNPDVYDKLLKDSGLTKMEFDSIADKASPTPKNWEHKKLDDGSWARYTKQGDWEIIHDAPEEPEPEGDIPWRLATQGNGRMMYVQYIDDDEEKGILNFKNVTSTTDEPKVYKPTKGPSQSTIDKADYKTLVSGVNEYMSSMAGYNDPASPKGVATKENPNPEADDPYISPQTYLEAKKEWTSAGLAPEDFDDEFEGFRNPQNPNYNVGGAKAESTYQKSEADRIKAEEKKKTAEEKKITTEEKAEADKPKGFDEQMADLKKQGYTKDDLEAMAEKKYGRVPDVVKNWIKANY